MGLRIGRVVGAHGLKGELKVEPLTEFLERFDPGQKVMLGEKPVTISGCRVQGERLLIQFNEITDRTEAENFQWEYIDAPEAELPELNADEYFSNDLIGMRVVDEEGTVLGEVEKVLPYPAHDVIVVDGIMIPAVKEFIKQVDLNGRRMVVHLIEGMRPE